MLHRLNSIWNYLIYFSAFKKIGKHVRIYSPLRIDGAKNIIIGDSVMIFKGTWLASISLNNEEKPSLEIREGVTIGHFNHIIATSSIIIEPYVLTASGVYISDNLHNYEDISLPIKKQQIKQCPPVRIGEGSWIGEHVCIIGASIGKHCVIGANAVVTHDIPDYCVAVGVPAKIIKRFDFNNNIWVNE